MVFDLVNKIPIRRDPYLSKRLPGRGETSKNPPAGIPENEPGIRPQGSQWIPGATGSGPCPSRALQAYRETVAEDEDDVYESTAPGGLRLPAMG